jgi:ABC-type branched-subunit amino acid transport system ATPase component
MSAKPILSLNQVTVRFGGLVAANNVTLSVDEGIIGAVIGPNGAGKTTIFNCITGIYNPTSGSVAIEETPIKQSFTLRTGVQTGILSLTAGVFLVLAVNLQLLWDASINQRFISGQPFDWSAAIATGWYTLAELPLPWTWGSFLVGSMLSLTSSLTLWARSRHTPHSTICRGVARTFQNIRLFKSMTVLENVLVGMHRHLRTGLLAHIVKTSRYRNEEHARIERAREILQFVGLDEFHQALATSLPYGLQRRLEIARALATAPKIILLDEPAAGMNATETTELMNLIATVQQRGITVLLIEHHMKLVMGISHHITVLEYGQKIAEGSPQEIRKNPRVISAYLGEPHHEH